MQSIDPTRCAVYCGAMANEDDEEGSRHNTGMKVLAYVLLAFFLFGLLSIFVLSADWAFG